MPFTKSMRNSQSSYNTNDANEEPDEEEEELEDSVEAGREESDNIVVNEVDNDVEDIYSLSVNMTSIAQTAVTKVS